MIISEKPSKQLKKTKIGWTLQAKNITGLITKETNMSCITGYLGDTRKALVKLTTKIKNGNT